MHENHANSPILICRRRSKVLQDDASLGQPSFPQLKPWVLLHSVNGHCKPAAAIKLEPTEPVRPRRMEEEKTSEPEAWLSPKSTTVEIASGQDPLVP
ncbi:hypothetical protein FDECE_13148 [Fusarium decemcellulare]|nr:hypothetical protein FDECE_13148 [Fusarium decemcellulare]